MAFISRNKNIDYCYLCKKTLTAKDMAFNPVNGGIKCDICLQKNIEKYEVKITISAVKILRLIVNEKRNIIAKIKQAEKIEEELKRLSQLFLICH